MMGDLIAPPSKASLTLSIGNQRSAGRGKDGAQERARIVNNPIWLNWFDLFRRRAILRDATANISVGYTTDVETVTFASSITPDFKTPYLKIMAVTGNFTLNKPADNGHCEYYLTVDSGGPYTITEGTDVVLINDFKTMDASTNYVLNVRRFDSTKIVGQLIAVIP